MADNNAEADDSSTRHKILIGPNADLASLYIVSDVTTAKHRSYCRNMNAQLSCLHPVDRLDQQPAMTIVQIHVCVVSIVIDGQLPAHHRRCTRLRAKHIYIPKYPCASGCRRQHLETPACANARSKRGLTVG